MCRVDTWRTWRHFPTGFCHWYVFVLEFSWKWCCHISHAPHVVSLLSLTDYFCFSGTIPVFATQRSRCDRPEGGWWGGWWRAHGPMFLSMKGPHLRLLWKMFGVWVRESQCARAKGCDWASWSECVLSGDPKLAFPLTGCVSVNRQGVLLLEFLGFHFHFCDVISYHLCIEYVCL